MMRIVAVGLLLGARHATDPDHLTAVSTLVLAERDGARRAGLLGALWGLGHGITLLLIGIPIVMLGRELPAGVHAAAELAIGLLIAGLAVRLLVRWRRGYFHAHAHEHDGVVHVHPHFHEAVPGARHRGHGHGSGPGGAHAHRHPDADRSPLAAFGLGLVHGVGGSALAGVLVAAAASSRGGAILTLVLFATSVAAAMAVATFVLGAVLGRASVARALPRLIPSAGVLALLFGLWYAYASLSPASLHP